MWKPNERNYDNIQFAELRKQIEQPYNDLHDELSDCYYNKKPFRNYGMLIKEQFDTLHALIFDMLAVKFHDENMKREDKYDENTYRYERDDTGKIVTDRYKRCKDNINELKQKGFELII